MSEIKGRRTLWKAAYWSLSTLLVVALALFIFWGLAILFETEQGFTEVLGLVVAFIGAILIAAGIKRPLFLLKPLLRKGAAQMPQEDDLRAFRMTFLILGSGLFVGGLIYAFTGNAGYLILCFLLSNLLLFLVASRRRRHHTPGAPF